jgi:hypothetical protein
VYKPEIIEQQSQVVMVKPKSEEFKPEVCR